MLRAPAFSRDSAAESPPQSTFGHSRSTASELPSANRLLAAPATTVTAAQPKKAGPPRGRNPAATSAAAEAATAPACSTYKLQAARTRSELLGQGQE